MIETCFQVLPDRGQVRALRAALRPPWNASSLLIGRHWTALSLSVSLSLTHIFSSPLFTLGLVVRQHAPVSLPEIVGPRFYVDI